MASENSRYRPPDRVTVEVTRELLEQLGEWSRPLQVKIEHTGNGYEMITRDPFAAEPHEHVTAEPAVFCGDCHHQAYMHRDEDREGARTTCVGSRTAECDCPRTCQEINRSGA